MAMKRRRSSLSTWGVKRRRTHRYVRTGRAGRRVPRGGLSITTRSQTARNVKVPSLTKRSHKAYRRALWNNTLTSEKFKSVRAQTTTTTTPASATTESILITSVFDEANPPWTATGGNQSSRFGTAAGSGSPEAVVFRGGIMHWTIHNNSTDNINVRYQLVWPKQQFMRADDTVSTNVPLRDYIIFLTSTPLPIGQTLQSLPDYPEYFHQPVIDKEVIIRQGEACKESKKIKLKRIDAEKMNRGLGCFPYIFLYYNGTGDASADTIRFTWGHSLTYCNAN